MRVSGTPERERLITVAAVFFHHADFGHLAIDFIGGCVHQGGGDPRLSYGFQNIKSAQRIDLEIFARLGD